ncbi:MAG: hypothetical protein IMX05_01415 [Hydrogenibacillus schlegelii]|nr:hypothetical protein [Hydrogenibacillus schlegelii]
MNKDRIADVLALAYAALYLEPELFDYSIEDPWSEEQAAKRSEARRAILRLVDELRGARTLDDASVASVKTVLNLADDALAAKPTCGPSGWTRAQTIIRRDAKRAIRRVLKEF